MVIGSPLRLDQTVTVGVVSAKGRSLGCSTSRSRTSSRPTRRSTSATPAGRWSTSRGEVVGIATADQLGCREHRLRGAGQHLKQILPQLRETGRVTPRLPRRRDPQPRLARSPRPSASRRPTAPWSQSPSRGSPAGRPASSTATSSSRRRRRRSRHPRPDRLRLGPGAGATVAWRSCATASGRPSPSSSSERPIDGVAAPAPAGATTAASTGWASATRTSRRTCARSHGMPESSRGVLGDAGRADSPLYDEGVRRA
jgi:hypothetical protein